MKLSNETYDILKDLALVWIPAFATMFFSIAQIWSIPYAEQIVGTISAVDVFLGAVLKVSSKKYREEKVEESY